MGKNLLYLTLLQELVKDDVYEQCVCVCVSVGGWGGIPPSDSNV